MPVFTDIYNRIRTNGCVHLTRDEPYSHVVYTNLIWLASYITLILYTTVNLFLVNDLVMVVAATALCNALFISCFLLIRKGHFNAGKHLLIISANLSIAVFDHLNGPEYFTWLMLFAFIPAAPNIFHFKKHFRYIITYMVLPLVYIFASQFYSYAQFDVPVFEVSHKIFFRVFSVILSFLLFVLFTSYMILRSSYKQRKLVQQSLSLQTTLNNGVGAIWSIDNDFNLVAVNKQYSETIAEEFGITGMKIGVNIKACGLWDKFPPDIRQQYHNVLAGMEILTDLSFNNRDFEIKAVAVYDQKQNIIGATFTSRNITANKKFEADLRDAKKKAEDASRAREQFLSNMSHEIRTPLNGIIGLVDILRDERILPGQKENLENLSNLSRHTVQLVNNILDFAKIEAGMASLDSKRFGLKNFIRKINSIFSTTTKLKGIGFKITVTGTDDIYVKGDEVSLSQVLINLIGNAIKFTEHGTVELSVTIRESEESPCYHLDFCVIDTGIGIKKEHFSKIFEGFNQADQKTTRKYGGTGLGLSISDKILSLMNSQLMVESEFGKGSRFFFSVALQKSSYMRPAKPLAESLIKKAILPGIKILLAEDNSINQIVAQRILEKWQSKVTVVDNGLQAFEAIKQNQYNIVLMDLDMPVMDGYESLGLIKTVCPEMPVIALTAASFDDMDAFLKKKGFNGVVQKPFVKDDLFNAITSLIEASGQLVANDSVS
jgi:signal transduction histidine kinase/ActR/RegA family two-component response regulator